MADAPPALRTDVLPEVQRKLWAAGFGVPARFVLYGGTALALRLGHRQSVDFDFFCADEFVPDELLRVLPFGNEAELLQSGRNTLTLLHGGSTPVKLSFFGGLPFHPIKSPEVAPNGIAIASLEDLFATKLAAAMQRSESKDYLDIAALVAHGLSLEYGLGCARAFYGAHFNSALPLKALVYFEDGDLPSLPAQVRAALIQAVRAVRTIPEVRSTGGRIEGATR